MCRVTWVPRTRPERTRGMGPLPVRGSPDNPRHPRSRDPHGGWAESGRRGHPALSGPPEDFRSPTRSHSPEAPLRLRPHGRGGSVTVPPPPPAPGDPGRVPPTRSPAPSPAHGPAPDRPLCALPHRGPSGEPPASAGGASAARRVRSGARRDRRGRTDDARAHRR